MLKKKIFGFFGKKEREEDLEAPPPPPETPVISNEQISSLENLSEGVDSTEAPEDIISKLAQINSIIGEEETDEEDELEDFFAEDSKEDEELPEKGVEEDRQEESPSIDTLRVAAEIVLQCFPQETLLDSVENLVSQYRGSNDFAFFFDRSDLLYGLSIGKLEFTIGQLIDKLPINVFQDQVRSNYSTKIELPIIKILPLVPVPWFVNREQDRSREAMVTEMEDLFAPTQPSPPEEESVKEEVEQPKADTKAPEEEHAGIGRSTQAEVEPQEAPYAEEKTKESFPGEATEELPNPQNINLDPDETRWSSSPHEVQQEIVGVSKLQPPVQREEEAIISEAPLAADQENVAPGPTKQPKAEKPISTNKTSISPIAPPITELPKREPEPPNSLSVVTPEKVEKPKPSPTTDATELPKREPEPPEMADRVPPQRPSVVTPEKVEKPKPKPTIDADEVREIAKEVFVSTEQNSMQASIRDIPADKEGPVLTKFEIDWKSQAPNGIDINRGGMEELMLLNGVGEHLARVIIDYRKTHGPFNRLQDLLKVPGLGNHTYRTMTRLSPRTEIRTAELKVNSIVNIDSEQVSLSKIASFSLNYLKLDAMFISSIDGLVLTKSVTTEKHLKLLDSLAAVAPQLYKRSKKALHQGLLPPADMITFYFDKRSVTFSGSDQLFIVHIHNVNYPHQKQLKECRKISNELVWYCSFRAVLS